MIDTLETLSALCRQHSLSWVADLGQEMPYRYQEHLMAELLDGLRSFRARVDEEGGAEGPSHSEIDTPTAAGGRR